MTLRFLMVTTTNTTTAHVRGAVRRLMARTGARRCMVVLDYLQKFAMYAAGGSYSEVRSRVNHALAALSELVQVVQAPVIVISSLSKQAYQRKVQDASIADFKDSGEVEYQGDIGMILRVAQDKRNEDMTSAVKVYDLWVVKNRLGASGRVQLFARLDETRFTELDPGDQKMPEGETSVALAEEEASVSDELEEQGRGRI